MPSFNNVHDLFVNAAIGYLSLSRDNHITETNPHLCRMLGYTREQIVGQPWHNLLATPEAAATKINTISPLVHTATEVALKHHSGNVVSVLMSPFLEDQDFIHYTLNDISLYKHSELQLQDTSKFLQAIFDNSQDAIVVMNVDGMITGWSKRAESMFGWSKDEAIGKVLGNLIVPERHRQSHDAGMKRFIKTGVSTVINTRIEITALHKLGHEIPIELTINQILLEGKIQFSSFIREITRRKKIQLAEQSRNYVLELLAKGASLKSILLAIVEGADAQMSNILVSILLLDRDGRHLITGAAPKLPDFYNKAIDGVEIGYGVGCCGTAAYTGERVVVEDIMTHPFWVNYKDMAAAANVASCWSQPIFNSAGKVLGIFAIYRTIKSAPTTEEIEIIEQIANLAGIAIEQQQSHEQLELLNTSISHLNDILLMIEVNELDKGGLKIIFVNDAFEKITGYSKEEVVGQSPRILIGENTQVDELDKIRHAIKNWEAVRTEILNYKKNGEEIWLEIEMTPIADSTGRHTHWVAVERDITDRKKAESAIKHLAFYDALTELPNRALLLDRLQRAITSSGRSQNNGALLFIDLDNFKTLNDTQGHDVGDELLKQVAMRLSSCVREIDTVARFGGDEFVVMLTDLSRLTHESAAMAKNIGEKILSKFTIPFMLNGIEYMSSPSIGITLFNQHLNSIDLLLKRADLAMYQAKAAGKNMMRFFDPEMQDVVSSKAMMESNLRKGIEQKDFLIYYQPQINIEQDILGFELLIRWDHPQFGIVSPSEFIPLAEETGLIVPIGLWIIREACKQLALWKEKPGYKDYYLAVNVSAKQFRHQEFVDHVLKIVDESGINPSRLKFELTESILVANVEETITKMSILKSIGIGFALDDFGTGYSSLAYLKRLPLDQLKIDRSFVRDVLVDPNDAIIIRTIIALGNSMGLSVIAEGVENHDQQEFLANIGCYAYQGYLFGKPQPMHEIELFVEKTRRTAES